MPVAELTKALGYDKSPNYLRAGTGVLETDPAFGHIFRLAIRNRHLRGVYALRSPASTSSTIPVVYVCEADSDDAADVTHRLVWNQDVVPFLLITTPSSIRLYSGFRHRQASEGKSASGILRVLEDFREITELTNSLHAEAIDDGSIWRKLGHEARPQDRVDWNLLDNLHKLDRWLQTTAGLRSDHSHGLIGKYVYLHYLKDRDILSKRKLDKWGISPEAIFGRHATVEGVEAVVARLEEWLNGGIFPIHLDVKGGPTQEHLRRVAATFSGDKPEGDGSWQLHLDFKAYDFSYIPIETLSVVYEQFLHMKSDDHLLSKGREAGAYYTPLAVVNFMLAELEDRRPLTEGMRVLDPSCGSGAFLVQCYRRLIERTFPATGQRPTPVQLRELLEKHIFGIDRDSDACSVTELSLILTLLDNVDPPDLENDRRFRLPSLRDQNILCSDFFDDLSLNDRLGSKAFDWIVGNPPWKRLNPSRLQTDDRLAWQWMLRAQESDKPVGGNQLAQAFVWRSQEYLDGEAGLLLPAMTLFEDWSVEFRKVFFKTFRTHSIANFANLAEVLFAGRSRLPAAAFFFANRHSIAPTEGEYISTYSPLVANQEATRPLAQGTRNDTWTLTLNASEIRSVPLSQALQGDCLPWKLAAWGSTLDLRLIRRLQKRFQPLSELEKKDLVVMAEGPQLRQTGTEGQRSFRKVDELVGKLILNVKPLARQRHVFSFPPEALETNSNSYVRSGLEVGLKLCRPPHVIVSAARNFAVYHDEYLIIPPRQIGIISPKGDSSLLKAISLYLSSDFAYYHQFLTSTELGVKRDRANLAALREMPSPFGAESPLNLQQWNKLHSALVYENRQIISREQDFKLVSVRPNEPNERMQGLLKELNDLVFSSLNLIDRERALVEDLVHVRIQLNDGKLGQGAVGPPTSVQMTRYAKRLKKELDAFIEGELPKRHRVLVARDSSSAMVQIDLVRDSNAQRVELVAPNGQLGAALEDARRRLRRHWTQWIYFNRNLRIFEGTRTYVFKPMQLFHWTESQAMLDAGEIIAQTLAVSRTAE
jgi:hypothetical protein